MRRFLSVIVLIAFCIGYAFACPWIAQFASFAGSFAANLFRFFKPLAYAVGAIVWLTVTFTPLRFINNIAFAASNAILESPRGNRFIVFGIVVTALYIISTIYYFAITKTVAMNYILVAIYGGDTIFKGITSRM